MTKHLILILGVFLLSFTPHTNAFGAQHNLTNPAERVLGAKHKKPDFNFNQAGNLPKAQGIHRIDWDKKLNLTDLQKQQLQGIYQQSQPEIDLLKKQINDARQKIMEIYKADDNKIRAILDEKQQIKFDKEIWKMQKNGNDETLKEKPSRKRMPNFGAN